MWLLRHRFLYVKLPTLTNCVIIARLLSPYIACVACLCCLSLCLLFLPCLPCLPCLRGLCLMKESKSDVDLTVCLISSYLSVLSTASNSASALLLLLHLYMTLGIAVLLKRSPNTQRVLRISNNETGQEAFCN
jgi:hypothetical protein